MSGSKLLRRNVMMMVTLGLLMSGASLLVSLAAIVMGEAGETALSSGVHWEELSKRLEDLEVEHDLVLDNRAGEAVLMGARMERLVSRVSTPPMCLAMPDPGPCTQNILRWSAVKFYNLHFMSWFRYYLSREGDCFQFPWGGCAGNDNRFLTRAQCLATCDVTHVSSDVTNVSGDVTRTRERRPRAQTEYGEDDLSAHHERCHQPPEAGPCTDRLTRHYFDGHACKM